MLWFAWSHDTVRDLADAPMGALDLEGRLGADVQMASAGEVYRRLQPAAATFTRWWGPGGLDRDLAEGGGLWVAETVGLDSWFQRKLRVDYGEGPPELVPAGPAPGQGGAQAAAVGFTTPHAWGGPGAAAPFQPAPPAPPAASGFPNRPSYQPIPAPPGQFPVGAQTPLPIR